MTECTEQYTWTVHLHGRNLTAMKLTFLTLIFLYLELTSANKWQKGPDIVDVDQLLADGVTIPGIAVSMVCVHLVQKQTFSEVVCYNSVTQDCVHDDFAPAYAGSGHIFADWDCYGEIERNLLAI